MTERETRPICLWERVRWEGERLELDPPEGYRLHHSWEAGTRAMVVCWERVEEGSEHG